GIRNSIFFVFNGIFPADGRTAAPVSYPPAVAGTLHFAAGSPQGEARANARKVPSQTQFDLNSFPSYHFGEFKANFPKPIAISNQELTGTQKPIPKPISRPLELSS
ncbi:MAG: hypothetical protein MUC42_18125, partial [Bryobacter sp.]|nr:hypothetical protein [Bryobacter sp.]